MKVDFLGFIFFEKSPRFVLNRLTLEEISAINYSGKIGVFVNENSKRIAEIAEKANLNFIQLHGNEQPEFISDLRQKLPSEIKIIKVIRIANQSAQELQKIISQPQSAMHYLLFDTDSEAFGGTGKTFNWQILDEINIPVPYFLSGGISEKNIKNLDILKQKPFAVDINSRYEISPGIKDLQKIKRTHEKL
jgi:phosphoribosylanthranilate isomerase